MEDDSCVRKVPVVSLCKLDYPMKDVAVKVFKKGPASMKDHPKGTDKSIEVSNIQDSNKETPFDPNDLEDVIKAYSIPVSEFRKINSKSPKENTGETSLVHLDSSDTSVKNTKTRKDQGNKTITRKNEKAGAEIVNESSKLRKSRSKCTSEVLEGSVCKDTKVSENSLLEVSMHVKLLEPVENDLAKSSDKEENILNEQKNLVNEELKANIGSKTKSEITADTGKKATFGVNFKIERRIVPIAAPWRQNNLQCTLRSKQMLQIAGDSTLQNNEDNGEQNLRHQDESFSIDVSKKGKSGMPYVEVTSCKRKSVLKPSQNYENSNEIDSDVQNNSEENETLNTRRDAVANIVKRRKISKPELKEENDGSEVYESLEYLKEDEDVVLLNKAAENFVVISCEDNISVNSQKGENMAVSDNLDRGKSEIVLTESKTLQDKRENEEHMFESLFKETKRSSPEKQIQSESEMPTELESPIHENGAINVNGEIKDGDGNLSEEEFQFLEIDSQREANPTERKCVDIISKGTPQYQQMWEYSSYIKLPNTMWSLHKEPTGEFMAFVRLTSKSSPFCLTFDKVLALELNTCPEIYFFGVKVNFPDTKRELRSPEHLSLFLLRIERVSLCTGIIMHDGEKSRSERCELYTEKLHWATFKCKHCVHKQKCIDFQAEVIS